jgi:hypothetical protein
MQTTLENIAAHLARIIVLQAPYKLRIPLPRPHFFPVVVMTGEGEAAMKRKETRNDLIEFGRASLEARGGPTGMDDGEGGYFRWPALSHG